MSLQLPILGQEPETPVSGPPKKRRRPALACLQCRRRKVRCDQNKPCNNCTKSRIPDCTFPQTHTPGLQVNELVTPRHQTPSLAPRRVPAPTTNHSLQSHGLSPRDIRPQHEARHTSSTQKARSMSSATGSPAVNTSSSSPQARIDGPNVDALLAKITELEKTVSKLSSSNDTRPEDVTASQKSASPARDGSSGHRFGNQSNWMNNTSLVSRGHPNLRPHTGLTNRAVFQSPPSPQRVSDRGVSATTNFRQLQSPW